MLRPKRRLLRSLLILSSLLLVTFIASLGTVGWIGSSYLISPPRKHPDPSSHPILRNPEFEGIEILLQTASDGTPYSIVRPSASQGKSTRSTRFRTALESAAIPTTPISRGTVILLHGHTSCKEDNLPIAIRLAVAGFDSIIPDLPGHGNSPHPYASFGAFEDHVIECCYKHAQTHLRSPHARPHLLGVSQGGSISLLAASRKPCSFASIVSLSTFTSLDAAMGRSASRKIPHVARGIIPAAILSARFATRLQADFDPADVSPRLAAKSVTNPTLIVHGTDDSFIPFDHAVAIAANLPNGKLYPVSHGTHNPFLAGGNTLYVEIIRFLCEHS